MRSRDYGYQLGRTWALGKKGVNDGVILLVAPKERKVRIEVGYGLEPVLTDALTSVILQTKVLPQFKQGRMEQGVIDGAAAIAQQLALPADQAQAVAAQAAQRPDDPGRRAQQRAYPRRLHHHRGLLAAVRHPSRLRRGARPRAWRRRHVGASAAAPLLQQPPGRRLGRRWRRVLRRRRIVWRRRFVGELVMKELSPTDLAAIEAAVREAERRTTGEIYCVVAEESSNYGETPLAYAAGVALLAPAILLLGGVHVSIPDFFSDGAPPRWARRSSNRSAPR